MRMERLDTMDKQQEFALRTVEERDVRFIRLWFTDVLGTLKSVAIAPAELEAAFEEGLGFDGSAVEGLTRVSEDDMIVMDLDGERKAAMDIPSLVQTFHQVSGADVVTDRTLLG